MSGKHPELVKRMNSGMHSVSYNGELDRLFNTYFSAILTQLKLQKRTVINLENPFVTKEYDTIFRW